MRVVDAVSKSYQENETRKEEEKMSVRKMIIKATSSMPESTKNTKKEKHSDETSARTSQNE